jgi:hypothetical protein
MSESPSAFVPFAIIARTSRLIILDQYFIYTYKPFSLTDSLVSIFIFVKAADLIYNYRRSGPMWPSKLIPVGAALLGRQN